MSGERSKRVSEIVNDLLSHQSADRDALLDAACKDDLALRQAVQRVLALESEGSDSLEQPIPLSDEPPLGKTPFSAGYPISHYRILGKIAEGGMGVVYKGEDTRLNRLVALKFLPARMTEDRQALERFKREARAASSLNHPNICTIYDIGEHQGQPFIVMEFLEGQTLVHSLRSGPLQVKQVVDFTIQIGAALQVAHSKGIIHRDIKPGNVLITTNNHIKLLDFGLAKLVRRAPTVSTVEKIEAPLTATGIAVGTPYYMSPEQLLDKELDGRTDIFSLGVLMYEMATGTLPFKGTSMTAVFVAILNNPHDPVFGFNPDLPKGLEAIIGGSLQKQRADRYQSVDELLTDLTQLKRSLDSVESVPLQLLAKRQQSGRGFIGVKSKGPKPIFNPFWWVIHQVNVMLFYALMVFALWHVKEWIPSAWVLGLYFGVFACAALNGTLRTHLLFTAKFNRNAIATEIQRVASWRQICDGILSLLLLLAGIAASPVSHTMAATLAALAVGYLVVFLIVEPATTRASFSKEGTSEN